MLSLLLKYIFCVFQPGLMGNTGGPFGSSYGGQGNQALGAAGLGSQLQNKGPMANSLAQFSVDKKNQPMQGMSAMVRQSAQNMFSFIFWFLF